MKKLCIVIITTLTTLDFVFAKEVCNHCSSDISQVKLTSSRVPGFSPTAYDVSAAGVIFFIHIGETVPSPEEFKPPIYSKIAGPSAKKAEATVLAMIAAVASTKLKEECKKRKCEQHNQN